MTAQHKEYKSRLEELPFLLQNKCFPFRYITAVITEILSIRGTMISNYIIWGEFYVHVIVHRDKFPYNKTK
jgi:hypothetical protein